MTSSLKTTPPLVCCVVLTAGLHPDGRVKKLLLETLDSVTKMNYENFKILVVDNGSIDGSQEAVRKTYPDVLLIENGANLGFGEGNNAGMRYALDLHAEWILLLNNDIEADQSMLSEMMNVALSEKNAGMLAPKIYYHDRPRHIWYAGGKINYWTGLVSHTGLREEDHGQYDTIQDVQYLTGCALLIRSDVLRTTGMFDPAFSPAYGEDADLSVRAARAGYRLMYVPRAELWHKVSSTSGGGTTPFKTHLKVVHNFIFFKRYARWYHWLTIPFCIGAMTMVFVIRELLKGNFQIVGALARGIGSVLASIVKPSPASKDTAGR